MDAGKLRESKSRAIKSLIGAILIVGVEQGTLNAMSNYVGSLCEKFNASQTAVVMIFTIASILSLTCTSIITVTGALEKVPIKALLAVGCVGFIGFFAFAVIGKSLIMLYIGAALFGVSKTFCGFSILHPLINFWHVTNVGKKLSSLTIAYSAFAMIISLIISRSLVAFGIQTTMLGHVVIGGAIMLLVCCFLVSNRPDSYGLMPYGYKEDAENTNVEKDESAVHGLTFNQSLKTFPFWACIIVILISGLGGSGYASCAALLYQSFGVDPIGAGSMMAIYSAMNVVWIFLFGIACDKMGPGKASTLFCATSAVVFLISSFVGGMASCYIVAFGVPMVSYYGMFASVLFPKLYGNKAIGRLINASMVSMALVSMAVPVITSTLFEVTGSYLMWLRLTGVLHIAGTVLLVFATSQKAVQKLKAQFDK